MRQNTFRVRYRCSVQRFHREMEMRINGGLRVQTLLALLYGSMAALNVATAPAQAAADTAEAVQSPPERKRLAKYRAPQGFNGYPWGTSLRELKGLAADPQYVQIAHSSGKVTELDWHCVENGANPCDLELTLQTTLQEIEARASSRLQSTSWPDEAFDSMTPAARPSCIPCTTRLARNGRASKSMSRKTCSSA